MISALILGFTIATPALAEKQVWQVGDGFVIRAHDLDLSRSDGREKLLARVEWASRRLCRDFPLRKEQEACANETRSSVLAKAPVSIRAALAAAVRERAQVQLAERW
jgi:UrcA family protein